MLLLVIALIFFLIIFLLLLHLRIEFVYKRSNNDDDGYILFSILKGFIRYRLRIKKIDLKGIDDGVEIETETEMQQDKKRISIQTITQARHRYHEVLERFSHFQGTIQWFLNKVICEKFSWSTSIGTGDAMETGVIVGVAWGLISTIVGFFGRHIQWRHTPELHVAPDFQQMKLESNIHFIIRFRIGNAICGIYRLLIQLRKKKEDHQWVNTLSKA